MISIRKRIKRDPASFGEARPKAATFGDIAKAYISKVGLSQSTYTSTFYVLSKKIYPHIGEVEVTKLTKRKLMDMEDAWRTIGNKQPTVNRQMSVVKAILNWAEDQELIKANPLPRYACKRGSTERIPPPSPTELDSLYACAPDHVRRAIILGAGTGARVGQSELLNIRWEDVRWKERTLLVWSASKNMDIPYREVPLSDDIMDALDHWRREDGLQVQTIIHVKGEPIKSFRTAWKATMRRAGITRRIRPYDLRHYFATRALMGGADLGATASIMGHADKNMILKTYQHVLPELQRAAMSKVELPTNLVGNSVGNLAGSAQKTGILARHDKENVKQ